jgi:cytochrome c551/c552
MEFFDNLVLPQSADHIRLINYLLVLILFLFLPYIGIMLVSSIISVFYRSKGIRQGAQLYKDFASVLIRIPTYNKSVGVILGIIPFLTITFMVLQVMHGTNTFILQFLLASFITGTIGVILIYTYRYSLDFEGIYYRIKNQYHSSDTVDEEIERSSAGSKHLASKSGIWGVLSLIVSLWLLITSTTMMLNPELWTADSIYVLSSWKVMVYFFQFLAISAALTGASILFFHYYWEGGIINLKNEISDLLKKTGLHLIFWGSIILPALMLISLYSLRIEFLSTGVFTASVIALVLLLLIYNLVYGIFKDKNFKLSGPVFFLLLFTTFLLIVKDQSAIANATEENAVVLNSEFQQYLVQLTGDRGAAEVNGKELFDVRCSSCHAFDQRMVGPAYVNVLPKYEGKIDQLVGFILNPDKIDPQFPPMPNPGLKPNEAKAVAEYIMETYKK